MRRLSMDARRGWDSLQRGPCWPHPPNAVSHTGVPSPSDIGIQRFRFLPVHNRMMHGRSRGHDGKAFRRCTARLGLPAVETLHATPTKCSLSYKCAVTIRHRNRALSLPASPPHCDAWLLTRARWEGLPWVHSAVGTPSSGDPAGHTHHVRSLI